MREHIICPLESALSSVMADQVRITLACPSDAVALAQEMTARVAEMRARVLDAEARIPQAMAGAFRSGHLGVMN